MNTGSSEKALRTELALLEVEEVLALCYSFTSKPQRMMLYMDALRQKGGQRAQFAACLICFDLAQQGNSTLQREFGLLAGTVRDISIDRQMVQQLLGQDPYLNFVWEQLEGQINAMDSRFPTEHTVEPLALTPIEDIAKLDLLSDDDFSDGLDALDAAPNHVQITRAYTQAVDRFLGKNPSAPVYHPHAGFRLKNRKDVERIEQFLLELDSMRSIVPHARAMRSLTLLFYGTHSRSKSFFGTINERKQYLLREGLRGYLQSGAELMQIAGIIKSLHSKPTAWDKILEVLIDYTHWCHRFTENLEDIDQYDAVERQIKRDSQHKNKRRTIRQ